MPRVAITPVRCLREDLEDVLAQADALDLSLVGIHIAEALEKLGRHEDGKARQFG